MAEKRRISHVLFVAATGYTATERIIQIAILCFVVKYADMTETKTLDKHQREGIDMVLLAIDTGTSKSAYVMVDTNTYKIEESGKVDNDAMMEIARFGYYDACVIEMFSSYGMRVGKEVFESVVMVGRIMEASHNRGIEADRIERQKVKQYVCKKGGSVKDADVIQTLKDRFGEKGTKKNPGFFFGFSTDRWQAFALAVAFIDMQKEGVDLYAL